MKTLPAYLRIFICSALLSLVSIHSFANHLVGMDFSYSYISGNTYKITLVAYGDCGSELTSTAFSFLPTNTPQIYIYNGDLYTATLEMTIEPPSAGVEITPVCPADLDSTQCTDLSYALPGIKKFVYSTTYTFPGPSSLWRILFTGMLTPTLAGRAISITNILSTPSDTYIQLVDTLNNSTSHNTNPVLSNVPTPFFCLNNDDNYNPAAVDPDGDSLTFFLVPGQNGSTTSVPLTGSAGLVTYVTPYTATAPLDVTTMSFDAMTGQVAFYPPDAQRSLVVYNIEEHRAGVLVGTSQREMTFLVQTCTNTPPTGVLSGATAGVIVDNTHFQICANSGTFSVNINPTEANPLNDITVTYAGLPAGATFSVAGNGTPTPHATFSWTSTGTPTGAYTFYVTYTDNNCPLSGTQTLAYTVTISPQPTVTYSSVSPATCTHKAAITVSPGGPGSPWIVDVSAAARDTIQTFTAVSSSFTDSLAPGTYTLTVYAGPGHGCAASASVSIAEPPPPVIRATFVSPSWCGINDGTLTIHGLYPGTTDTVRYLWDGLTSLPYVHLVAADSTITISGLPAGAYSSITGTYDYCISLPIGPEILTDPPFTMRTITSYNPVYCGICNGGVTLFGLHPGQLDTINYTFDGVPQTPVIHLIGADSTVSITGLCAGTYASFIAHTAGICVSNTLGPVTLTVPPFTIRSVTTVNPDFCGICNGSFTIHGVHPSMFDTVSYTFDGVPQTPFPFFVGGDSTITITGLCAGVYDNITVKTGGVCVSNVLGPVTLTVPPFTMRAISFTDPVYCGICNGTITLFGLHPGMTDTISYTLGGVPQPVFVHLIGADSTVTITGLCVGTYDNFIARSGSLCISNTLGPVTLAAPPFTMRALTSINPSYCGICNGSITLYGLYPGETDSIHYTIGGVAQTPVVRLIGADSTVTLTGLCAGVYDNFVAHTAGVCVSNTLGPVTLTVPPFTMRAISFTNPAFCGICNGTITLYGLYPGETDSIHYTLDGVPQTPFVALIGADSMVTITGLCAGTYAAFVAHTGGVCVSNTLGPVTLTVPPFTMRAISFTDPPYCGICTGTITLYGLHPGETDSIHYTKDGVPQPVYVVLIGADSTVTLTGLCAGVYADFIATTGGVCVSNTLGPVDLTVPPFTMRALSFTNPAFCGICNGTITLYGLHPGQTDTINYTIDGAPQTPIVRLIGADSTVALTGLCAGLYDNFVANTGGVCISNTLGPADLLVPAFTMRALSYTNPTKCGFCDGTVTLYGLHPGQVDTITFTFNGAPQPQVSGLIPPDSMVQITGLCEGVYDNFVAKTAGVCVTNVLGPVTLVAPPITAGYNFTVSQGCKADTVLFTNTSEPAADLTYQWNFGDGTTDTATNPSHIYYSPGSITAKLLITNTKCFDSSIQTFQLDNLINAGFTEAPDSFLCQHNPVVFTNTSTGDSLQFIWYYGDGATATSVSNSHVYTKSGIYDVMLTVANYVPCRDTVMKQITVDTISAISISATDSVICGGTSIEFTGNYAALGNTGVIWTFSDSTKILDENPVVHSFPAAGVYTITIEATYRACPDTSTSRKVVIIDRPGINLGPDTAICPGSAAIPLIDDVNASNPHATWIWSTGETTAGINVVAPGEYWATVDIDGCRATDSVEVTSGCYMDIPNAFTPNGDGINDYFFPRLQLTKGLATFKMDIYNRWGQLIFETTSTEGRGWDGRWNDVMQPEGVFIYTIEATFIDGEIEHHNGNVTLLK